MTTQSPPSPKEVPAIEAVSDLVLLQELPQWLKDSVAGYIGCLGGAMLREHYLDAVKAAGFHKVKITDETSFPIDYMLNDPTAQALMRDFKIFPEKAKEIADSVVSIKVSGIKPVATVKK